MNVIYLFCEGNAVKIPFLGYNSGIIRQLRQFGGVWDAFYCGFIFQQEIEPKDFKKIFDVVCVVFNKNPENKNCSRLHIYGLWDQEKEEKMSTLLPRIKTRDQFSISCRTQILCGKFSELLVRKLETEMRSRKLSVKTQKAYIYYNTLLCNTLQKSPEEIFPDDVTGFLAVMEKERGYSAASINLAISAVKFLFKYVLKDNRIKEQKRPGHNKTLPAVLSAKEIFKILSMEKNSKHRILLMLVYSSGLRVSEVVALKKEHIDLSRQVIYIRQGKGRKDRYTMLSEIAAQFILEYYELFKIDKWIFPGQSGISHLTIRSAQRIFDKAVRHAGITKKISIHGLRHTFATHLLENGTDIRYIQTLLGHSNIRTTERYTHVARRNVLSIKSPLDSIQPIV